MGGSIDVIVYRSRKAPWLPEPRSYTTDRVLELRQPQPQKPVQQQNQPARRIEVWIHPAGARPENPGYKTEKKPQNCGAVNAS